MIEYNHYILWRGTKMDFYGLQKMTLLDFPKKVACTVFTGGCNFRCPFCHNALLVTKLCRDDIFSEQDILDFLKKREGLLDGVCVTGGEPLMQKELPAFLEKVKAMGFAVKVDTNGSFPDLLKTIMGSGLCDYVAMDIKNSKEKYAETVGIPDFDTSPIERSVEILKSGAVPFEFRTTVVKELHGIPDIEAIAKWISPAENFFLQQFVDSGDLIGRGLSAHSTATLEKMRDAASEYIPNVQIRGTEI